MKWIIILLLTACASKNPVQPLPTQQVTPTATPQATLPVTLPVNGWYKPKIGMKWNIQFATQVNASSVESGLELIDVDMFDTPTDTIQELKKKGIKVICYFSAGSSEDWRADFKDFPKSILGKDMEGWEGEKWLDISKVETEYIMGGRIYYAYSKGCDGVDFDNMDGYTNDTGFKLTYEQQLKYNKSLAQKAHDLGMAVGLKNDLLQIKDLVDIYDFSISEQCFQYEISPGHPECEYLIPFIQKGKPVFGIEYKKNMNFCAQAKAWKMDTIRKSETLNEQVWRCP